MSASTTSKRQRAIYSEMLRDARDGLIDGIVVYSIDRLTRRITELTSFLEEQKEHGFAFTTTEGEDTSTANGRMILTIKGAVAQQETERMSERVNSSLLHRREKGKPHAGGPRVFGFEPGSNQSQKTPGDVGPHVERGRRADPWHPDRVDDPEGQARVQVRAGRRHRHLQGQDIGDSIYPHPLTREEWENVQAVLDGRATPAAQGSGKRKHVYSGFLKCGNCGSTMRVQWATIQGRTFRRTFCNSSSLGRNGQLGCGKVSRSYAWIEERLNEVMEAALSKRQPQPQAAPTEDLTDAISVQEERIRGLRNRWKGGETEDEDYFDSLKHLRDELQALRAREAAAVVQRSRTETDVLAVWRDESAENVERRRTIVASVIKEVAVFSVGRGRQEAPRDHLHQGHADRRDPAAPED